MIIVIIVLGVFSPSGELQLEDWSGAVCTCKTMETLVGWSSASDDQVRTCRRVKGAEIKVRSLQIPRSGAFSDV